MPSRSRPPLSPEAAAVVRALSAGGRLSRRSLLRGAGGFGLGAALAGCGGGSTPPADPADQVSEKPSPATDVSDTEKVVRWANFPLYLDMDDDSKSYPTLKKFQDKTGIVPSYYEDVEDNDSYYGQVQAQLRRGQDVSRDVIVFTDWMAARVIKAGWIQKLNRTNIPNAANLLDSLSKADYDPGRNYSLTWQSGYTGLGWNVAQLKALTGLSELKSVADLWNPKLKGRVEVLSEMRDTMGLILQSQGVAIDKAFEQASFDAAIDVLEKQLANGQIRQVRGNSYKQDLVSGDAVAVIGWSGDVAQLNLEARDANPGLKSDPFGFALPDSGGMLWSDNLLVPIGARHKTNAEILMNYYYDPKVAAQVAAYVHYICPVKGAQQEMLKLPGDAPALAGNPYIFPSAQMMSRAHTFRSLSAQEEKDFTDAFRQVLGA
jgi:spermidine/putrescine transport system substrate-binding protein